MSSDAKTRRLDCGTAAVDRISNLPRNIIVLIFDCLPIHDAARTSVLSKTWRALWGLYPNLVFDEFFFDQLLYDKDEQDPNVLLEVTGTISDILLVNRGPILKFHLFVPDDLPLHQYRHMDLWIRNISNHGVRQLELFYDPPTAYKMPSYLFSCSELTHLCLTNCILNPPLRFGGFSNLIEVKLEEVIITGNVLFGSHLKVLKLRFCDGIENLESQFKQNHSIINLVIQNSGEIDFTWFECTRKVQKFCLTLEREADSKKNYINLDKLVGNMTEIRILRFDGFLLKVNRNSYKLKKLIFFD
ncbi:hypothetical protein POM88_030719 [Heracleum sosnowskyi]|uniref:F-box domain-containing protein n=1 Tax=Heracleum sosnowskyi TaxID=360622 RepID=A0AAD8HWG0_9APIA|nr:hypothetical protein POM88_030719 [Heracleum sosnowskyi]